MDKVGVPETGNQAQGRVIPQFEVTTDMLAKASKYVMGAKTTFESQRLAVADDSRKSWTDRLVQCDRAYRAILEPERNYKGFSDKCSPIIHNNIEMLVARLKESILFSRRDQLVKIDSQSPNKYVRETEVNTQFEKQDIDDKVERFLRGVVKFGTSWIKVPLLNQEKTILTQQLITETVHTPIIDDSNTQIIDANGQPMFHTEQVQSIQVIPQADRKYFGPGYIVIDDVERVYADAFIEDPQDQPIIVEEIIVNYDHLMDGIQKGIYIESQILKIKDKTISKINNSSFTGNLSRSEQVFGSTGTQFNSINNTEYKPKEYRMYQAWCDFAIPYEENGEKGERTYSCVISVIENEVIQIMPNPFFHQMKPYIKGTYTRIEGELYGQSAIDAVLGLFFSYNDTFNQIEDNKVLKLNGITIAPAGAISDAQDFSVGAGEVWYEKETGSIRPYIIDFPMAEGAQYLNQLEEQINKGMGITPLMMGSGDSTDADKTYRGVTKVIAESEKQFKMKAKHIEDACIRQVAEMFLKVNLQFNPMATDQGTFEQCNSESGIKVFGVESFFEKKDNADKLIMWGQQAAQIPGINRLGILMAVKDMLGIEYDEQKYGPIYQQPPPPMPEEKPLNTSVTMPVDMSKGPVMLFVAAQLLKQKGIDIDVDSVAEATKVFADYTDPNVKAQSGILPPAYDSYSKGDSRSKANKIKAKKETVDTSTEDTDAE